MNSNELWTAIYDIGYKKGVETLSFEQQQLWYYIDFTIYVDNGGASGFVYNKSPDINGTTHFSPYLKSWRFFNYNTLADLVERYNDQFLKALQAFKQNEKIDFKEHSDRFGLPEIEKQIEPYINEVNRSSANVWAWINQDIDKLNEQVKLLL